jgi:hypothetical protein
MEMQEDKEKVAAVRYEALGAHYDELYREVDALLDKEHELTEVLIDAILECKDTKRLLADLEVTWAALTPRQAALSRTRELLRCRLRAVDQAT